MGLGLGIEEGMNWPRPKGLHRISSSTLRPKAIQVRQFPALEPLEAALWLPELQKGSVKSSGKNQDAMQANFMVLVQG